MPIYLYVKTHTDTGLKYLGKTSSKDPHKYPGSGKYWQRHLKAHGFTYTTEILKECDHPDEIKFWGQHYSDLWNIVESDEWANLKPESGDGGSVALKGLPGPNLGKVATTETRNKMSRTRKGKSQSKEHVAARVASRAGYTPTPETLDKIGAKLKGRVPWNKGLTKETNESIAKYANTKTGKPRPDMAGKEPWNKGKKKG